MQLEFELRDQILKRKDQCKPFSNSQGYLKAHFIFLTEYEGTVTAHFKANHNGVMVEESVTVENELCNVPDSMIQSGMLYVWLSIATDTSYIPTNTECVCIGESGNSGSVLPLPDSTINQYEEITRMYNEILSSSGGTGSGTVGVNGKSIEYSWLGTSLGVRQEGDTTYQFVDLKGTKGDKGDKGDQGLQGIQGVQGIQGLTGAKGDTGAQGIQGAKGNTGSQGLQGIQGIKGDKGDTGATGSAGTGIVNQRTGLQLLLWEGTQAQYDALGTYDSNMIYLISG